MTFTCMERRSSLFDRFPVPEYLSHNLPFFLFCFGFTAGRAEEKERRKRRWRLWIRVIRFSQLFKGFSLQTVRPTESNRFVLIFSVSVHVNGYQSCDLLRL